MNIIPYLFLLNSQYSWATPIAQGGAIASPCVINTGDRKSYTITSQNDVVGEPDQLPFWCTPTGGARMLIFLDQGFFSLSPDHANVTLSLYCREEPIFLGGCHSHGRSRVRSGIRRDCVGRSRGKRQRYYGKWHHRRGRNRLQRTLELWASHDPNIPRSFRRANDDEQRLRE